MKKHAFDRELVKELRELNKLDNYHGILLTAYDWLLIFASVLLSEYFLDLSSVVRLLLTCPIYVVAIVIISSRINALYEIFHASAHYSLANNVYLNYVLGTLFAGWAIFDSWTGYHKSHVVLHHNNLGELENDPDYQGMVDAGLYRKGIKSKDITKFLWTIPSPIRSFEYMKYLLKNKILPIYETNSERMLRILYWSSITFLFWKYESVNLLIIYWVIPYFTIAAWIADLLEFTEHYPLLKIYDEDIKMSWNRKLNILESFFLGNHNEDFHLVHHLWPRIPNWNLAKAHEIMMKDKEYNKFHNLPRGLFYLIEKIKQLTDSHEFFEDDNGKKLETMENNDESLIVQEHITKKIQPISPDN